MQSSSVKPLGPSSVAYEKEKQFKRTLLEANRPATEDERKVAYKPLLWRNDKVLSPTQQLIEAEKYLIEVTVWE